MQRLEQAWRQFGTAVSFAVFGIGGLLIGAFVFPLIHLLSMHREAARRRCQIVVRRCFAIFIWLMKSLGVLSYEWEHGERLNRHGLLVVANHPSLIDVVFIISRMPNTLCVVKSSHWRNPFVMGVMHATGYIPNNDPVRLVEDCVLALSRGFSLVIFPEGTRTASGGMLKLKRGAASIIAASGKAFTPVTITVAPTTLTKEEKWYQVPHKRPHWTLRVAEDVSPGDVIVKGEVLSRNNRRVNRMLKEILDNRQRHRNGPVDDGESGIRIGSQAPDYFHA